MVDQQTVQYLGTGLLIVCVLFMIYYQYYRNPCDFPPHVSRENRLSGDVARYCGIKNWNNPDHSMQFNTSDSLVTTTGDASDCRELCDQTAGCTGFVYNTANRSCWLKEWPSMSAMASGTNSFNPCCSSYIRN
jgi:hypothetical protein